MSNYCNTKHSIFVNNSIILKSTNQLLTDSPGPQLHCTSDLVTDTGSRLLIHFISLSISIENDTPDKYVHGIAILENILSVNLYDTKFSETDIFWYPSLLKYVSFSLHIYDVDANGHAQMVTPTSGLFGIYDKFFKRASMGVGDYISTGNRFRLTYVGSPTLTYRGFDILVTSLKGMCRLLKKDCWFKNCTTSV